MTLGKPNLAAALLLAGAVGLAVCLSGAAPEGPPEAVGDLPPLPVAPRRAPPSRPASVPDADPIPDPPVAESAADRTLARECSRLLREEGRGAKAELLARVGRAEGLEARREVYMALGEGPGGLDPDREPNDRALLDLLGREPDPELMPTAAATLVRLGGEHSADPVLDLWRRADENARAGIVDALATVGPDLRSAAVTILDRLEAEVSPLDPELRARADDGLDR